MNNELQNRFNRLKNDIKELKSNQYFGGDSWLVYRSDTTFAKDAATVIDGREYYRTYQIDFIPDEAGDFIARAWAMEAGVDFLANGIEWGVLADPNINGRWYDTTDRGAGLTARAFIYSTRKGKVVVTPLGIAS